ncbi:MAG TPA: 4-(cytidine 5'-diphospho)-2-C-methyl-D-erythritol kinase [Erysipelotrichaceae bacterium]|nr:4-(cytidine 5'-diphospho)-2-C-methyl-D-erythritol kinase [Erysipelotrichaceae bacterium]HQB32025.1 4-(cytidine 5'-diphospho)-2-C-methyl-D-erythritol kinase [Erysipelotrichaceae bacterium]
MIEKAYGKINISIDVISKREDGYHNMDMIMVPIDLYDVIDIEIAQEGSYCCNDDLPYDESNIIYRCIELLRKECGFKEQFSIKVTKNIPQEAGLAGGSTDGAAALRIVNKLLDLKLSKKQLSCIGKKIGADIPFCIYQKIARVRGIGDIIEPFELKVDYDVLLIKPEQGIDTRTAFQMLDLSKCPHPDIDKVKQALVNGEPLKDVLGNSLLYSAERLVPEVLQIIEECRKLGFEDALMTGSGTTVFVLLKKGQECKGLQKYMEGKYPFVYKTSIIIR